MADATDLGRPSPNALTQAHEALRAAVVTLAQSKPVTGMTVSEVCRKAGVSRDSFYRFASSPSELLAQYLYDDHDVVGVVPDCTDCTHAVKGIIPAMHVLVAHAQRNFEIYRHSIEPHFPPHLQDALLRRMVEVLEGHVCAFPERLPALDHGRRDPVAVDAFISYLAFATLGAIESLVRSGGIKDTELSVAVLKAAIAPSWLAYD